MRMRRNPNTTLQIAAPTPFRCGIMLDGLQGFLTYKKMHPPTTLPWVYAQGPMGVLWGWDFLMSEVHL